MEYREIGVLSREAVETAIAENDPDCLLYAVLSAALYSEDAAWAKGVCARLAVHPHFNVRGNALLGLGQIARIHGRLMPQVARPLVEAGLRDRESYVRRQAESTADDIEFFLGWRLDRPAEGAAGGDCA